MDAHLKEGCERCGSAARHLGLVRESEAAADAPEEWVARAMAVFPKRAKTAGVMERLVAALTYDSRGEALPAGVRSGGAGARRLAYEAEGTVVELLVNPEPARRVVQITGQITRKGERGGMRVRLLAGKRLVGETEATEYGEFHVEVEPRAGIRMVFTGGGREIELSLQGLVGRDGS
jgi:hypothetical protein